jgi:hypothetical protein
MNMRASDANAPASRSAVSGNPGLGRGMTQVKRKRRIER